MNRWVHLEPNESYQEDRYDPWQVSELKKFPDGEIRCRGRHQSTVDDNVRVLPKHLELSNVNITEELINSIEDQRQYEINIKMISSASELDEAGATLMRMPS